MNILKQLKNYATDTTTLGSSRTENWYITAERAEGVFDKDRFSKSDPYLKIKFGGKSVRTRTINNDRSPAWNETFHFKVSSGNATDISLKLVDDDIGLDDTIGKAVVSRSELPTNSGEEKYIKVPVLRKEQIGGIIHLKIKKIVDGVPSSSSSSTTSQQSHYHHEQQQMPSKPYYDYVPQQQQQQQQQPQQQLNRSAPYNSTQQPYYQTQVPPSYPGTNQSHSYQPQQPLYQPQPSYQPQSSYQPQQSYQPQPSYQPQQQQQQPFYQPQQSYQQPPPSFQPQQQTYPSYQQPQPPYNPNVNNYGGQYPQQRY